MTLADLPLGPLERFFADSLLHLEPDAPLPVLVAGVLCCQALAAGDVCLPLARLAGQRVFDEGIEGFDLPPWTPGGHSWRPRRWWPRPAVTRR